MTVKRKGGDVVIRQQENVIHLGMWRSMRCLHGGPQTRMYCHTQMFPKMTYNLLKFSYGMENLRL